MNKENANSEIKNDNETENIFEENINSKDNDGNTLLMLVKKIIMIL